MNPCKNCGSEVGDENPPNATHCGQCPPTKCDDCGGICDWQSGALCSCWTDLGDLSIADQKALFAACEDDCDEQALTLDPVASPTPEDGRDE